MNRITVLITFLLLGTNFSIRAQLPSHDVEVVTCVESLVPDGLGRSRMITTSVESDYQDYTSQQTAAKKNRNRSKRRKIRLKQYEETKLLNFYNEGGIRFQNVATNDALVTSKINSMLSQDWELFFVQTGVESKMIDTNIKKELLKMGVELLLDEKGKDDNKKDPNGLFLTRYYFRKKINYHK